MLALYLAEKERGSGDQVATQSVAAGFGEDPAHVIERLIERTNQRPGATSDVGERAVLQGHLQRWALLKEQGSGNGQVSGPSQNLQSLLKFTQRPLSQRGGARRPPWRASSSSHDPWLTSPPCRRRRAHRLAAAAAGRAVGRAP